MMWKNAIRKLWDNNRIKNAGFLVAATVISGTVLMSGLSAKAVDGYADSEYVTDTTGDSFTLSADQVRVSQNCYYDRRDGRYYYYVSGFGEDAIEANVCNGMVYQGEAKIRVASGIVYDLYKDGILVEEYDGEDISAPGSYSISIYNNTGKNDVPLTFTIIGDKTNKTSFTFPNNIRIISVTQDSMAINHSNYSVDFASEGDYKIIYRVEGVDEDYNLKLTVDLEPPVLALSELDEKGRAYGPVDISDLEENCDIYITLDGEEIRYSEELTAPGTYVLVLTDAAGNQTTYSFTIMIYFNTNSLLFFALLLAVVAGIIAYMIYVHKHFRVR